ncbi:chemotaxis protein CheA [Sphingobium sp. SCG-1]|uniref:chemotaxis protein CheA n=1 Tax=Sphingobium sp. SCG-1 TaxID=2072936 RepID=UPI000CD6BF84|nr:chemotaxis protein CheW [Sphingobium sp. SCG-1]AUW60338.1 chemotaxis protein CheA [Sphingobium sp. SCG-1]
MDELLGEFISETQETLEALAGIVVAWEADPSDRERLDSIFRFFHTVKGSCGFLNLPRFERLSHAAEDVLSDIRDGRRVPDPVTVNAVLAVMDRIGELTEAVASGASLPSENDELLIGALRQVDLVELEKVAEPATVAAVAPKREQGNAQRTIRLPLTLIDQLMNGVSDMVLARNELSRKLRDLTSDPDLDSAFERLSTCVADMRDSISKTRMQRVDRLFAAIPRMVRDLCRDLGKRVELDLEGGDVEMDREMVEMVVDPLTHIVRNSIDHGIELPADRAAAGKPETGVLRVAARQSGNQIVIEISDDGRGIDSDRLVRKAMQSGDLTPDAATRLTEAEKLDMIFRPGLSTAQAVTAVSGRGVGMDVVRANVERIGGVIALDNQPGRGLKITLRVPLTLTIIPGLIIKAGGQQFAIPRAAIVEILHVNNETLSIERIGGACIATIRKIRHAMIDLEDVLGLPLIEQQGPRTIMVVRSASGIPFAMGVSAVDNHEELVIRPASPLIMASGVYAGMTLPDNGQPMLLLDAGGLANAANLSSVMEDRTSRQDGDISSEIVVETLSALHFEELSGEERLLRLSLIERVEDLDSALFGTAGGRAFVRVEGRLLPVAADRHKFDRDCVTALRIRDGERELCYPVARVIDIVQMPAVPDMLLSSGILSGIAVINDVHLEILDPFALFAANPVGPEANASARCVIADAGDVWAQEILAPLLRQAGHDVLLGLPEDGAVRPDDVVLYAQADTCTAMRSDQPAVQIRNLPSPKNSKDRSVYRYDRDGLMAAISAARREKVA